MPSELTAGVQRVVSSGSSPQGIAGLAVLGALPALCLIAELSGIETYLGFACLVPAVVLFCRRSTLRFGAVSLAGIFSVAAAVHAVGGLILAGPGTDAIWGSTNIRTFYPRAFMVIAAGLLAASIGYGWALHRPMGWIARWCTRLAIDDSKLLRWAQALTVAGAA